MTYIYFELGCKIFFEHIAAITPYYENDKKTKIDNYQVFTSAGVCFILSIEQYKDLIVAYDFYQYSLPINGRCRYYELKPNN
jgi:hypothetical protein